MKKIKKILFASGLSLLICFGLLIVPGFINSYSRILGFGISYLTYFFTVILLLHKRYNDRKTIIVTFIATFLLLFVFLFSNTWDKNMAIPAFSGYICACILAYLFAINHTMKVRVVILVVFFGIGVLMVFGVYPRWENHLYFGSFSQEVHKPTEPTWINYTTKESDTIGPESSNKIVILDFFTTGCSVCFKKFPLVEDVFTKYKNNKDISLFAVNIPLQRDTPGMALHIVRNKKYTFPVVIGKRNLDSFFEITAYPTTIVLRNNVILFKGDIENVPAFLQKLTDNRNSK